MQPSDDPALLRTLAERVVGAPLLVGALPQDLPLDLPMPDGTRVVGSIVRPGFRHPTQPDIVLHPEQISVYLDVPGAPTELESLYIQACHGQGWTLPFEDASSPTRPRTARSPGMHTSLHARGPDDRYMQIAFGTRPDRRCDVRIDFGTMPDTMRDSSHNLLRLLDRILAPISGLERQGGHSSKGVATAEAVCRGDESVAAVEARIAERCVAAGWTRREGGVDGPLAWSRWAAPAGEDHDVWLLVMEGPGAGRSSVAVRVQSLPSPEPASELLQSRGRVVFSSTHVGVMRAKIESMSGIACPRCGAVPMSADVWSCMCGTAWNTFNTRGRCPGCGQRWTETACLTCTETSPHEDWYKDGADDEQ